MELIPLKSKRTEEIKRAVQDERLCRYGYPSTIHGDNERSFIGEEMSSFCSENGIRYTSSAAYDKRQNGQVERSNRCVAEQLKIAFDSGEVKRDWVKLCKTISMKYNMSWNRSIGESPYYVVFGKTPVGKFTEFVVDAGLEPEQIASVEAAAKKVRESQMKVSGNGDSDSKDIDVILGDLVWWMPEDDSRLKFELFKGPYVVEERKGSNNLKVRSVEDDTVHSVSLRHVQLVA